MEYLNPNETHQIEFPIKVNGEYTVPSSDGVFHYRIGNDTVKKIIPPEPTTTAIIELETPDVPAGELKIITCLYTVNTPIGMSKTKRAFGVVDLLDIPIEPNDVREVLGVTEDELYNIDLNIESTYVDIYKLLINNFHTLRQTNAYLTKRFGDFIAVSAAIRCAPQLIIKLDKKRSTENGDFQRLIDPKYFEDYLANLLGKLKDIEDDLEEFLDQEEIETIPYLQLGTGRQWSIDR